MNNLPIFLGKFLMRPTALLVIDFINDIVHPKGKIPGCAKMVAEKDTLKKANKIIQHAEKNSWLIIFVTVAFSEDYLELPFDGRGFRRVKELGALQKNQWGTEYVQELYVPKNSLALIKNRINVFYNTNLDLLLRANNIQDLYLCGVSTEMAIQSTARDAVDRDYNVHVLSDACAGSSEEKHNNSLSLLQDLTKVITVENLLK